MKSLVDFIACRPADQPLLVHADQELTTSQVLTEVERIRSSAVCQPGQVCFIFGESELEAILTLIAADGWSTEVTLGSRQVPASSEPQEASATEKAEPPLTTRWQLATSGSTGSPKWVAHQLSSLSRTVKADREHGKSLCWGLLYNPLRFAGLQVVLQALLGGSSLVIPSDRQDFTKSVLEFERHRVNALSATPSYWRKLLMAGLGEHLNLKLITLGGETADGSLLATLKSQYPRARITHIYASTEAGVGFSVSDREAGFPATFLENPPQGVELKVDAHGQLLVRPGDSTPSYVDGSQLADGEGWIATGDLVERRGSRYYFLGRANRVINVGGNKLHPREIEEVALGVPGVALARVQPKPSHIVGQVPELLVMPSPTADPPTLREEVLQHCRAELPREKWPARVVIIEDLQLSEAGKNVSAQTVTSPCSEAIHVES